MMCSLVSLLLVIVTLPFRTNSFCLNNKYNPHILLHHPNCRKSVTAVLTGATDDNNQKYNENQFSNNVRLREEIESHALLVKIEQICDPCFNSSIVTIIPDLQGMVRAALLTTIFAAIQFCHPSACVAEIGYVPSTATDPARLKSCKPNTNCVSSGYLEPPNRYMSPLKTLSDQDTAYRRAIRDLTELDNKIESSAKDSYIHVEVPGTTPGSIDDVELLFAGEGIVNVRCEARVTLPSPPFCVKKNCINGNMDQRTRVEKIARALGLPAADSKMMEQTAKWTPIFFNSDRVPDLLEYDDY